MNEPASPEREQALPQAENQPREPDQEPGQQKPAPREEPEKENGQQPEERPAEDKPAKEQPPMDRHGRPFNARLYQTCRRWADQEKAARAIHPKLDLAREAESPLFLTLLHGGADVLTAYEGVHHRRLMGEAMARAARQGAGLAARSIAQRSRRPRENGAGAEAGGWQGLRAQDLTPAQVMELADKARRGQKTRLG